MRPLALGRKNWLHLGSPQAGPKVAVIYTTRFRREGKLFSVAANAA
jgi:hypothetical protein